MYIQLYISIFKNFKVEIFIKSTTICKQNKHEITLIFYFYRQTFKVNYKEVTLRLEVKLL